MGKFVIRSTKSGGFTFVLKAGNGEVVGVSETYNSKAACKNGIESVMKNCLANVEDTTKDEKVTNPKFEIYKDKKEEFRFRLKASNGEIILASEGYATKDGCKKGIGAVGRAATDAEIIEEA